MADFCKQCSEELFGEDYGDFRYAGNKGYVMHCICEGCGDECIVDRDGKCISETCLKKHGASPLKQDDIVMQENEIAREIANDDYPLQDQIQDRGVS